MSYTKLLYHIIFRTKKNENVINEAHEKELYAYIMGFIKNKKSHLYRIGGMPDHIHILTDIHPSIAVSDFMRDMKSNASKWLKKNSNFPHFNGWAESFAAFTYNEKEKDIITNYIKKQKVHHAAITFEEKLRQLLIENGIKIDEHYFLKD